jgi:integrase/recombinase XerD
LEQTSVVTINPTSNLDFKRLKSKEREVLTQEEIKELYQATTTLLEKAVLGMFYGCGLRELKVKG